MHDSYPGFEGVKSMFLCGECKFGELWMSGNSLIEHLPGKEDHPAELIIDSSRIFEVKLVFTCESCRTEFILQEAGRFKQFPE